MTRKREDLTQEELKEHLHYDPDTGIFTRLISMSNSVQVGDIAGHTDKTTGYNRIFISNFSYRSHRLAWLYMYGKFPANFIDHIDGDRVNNKIVNLRQVSNQENSYNHRKCNSNNSNGFLGVFKCGNKFRACIVVNQQKIHLGSFNTPEEAHQAYLKAKRIHHSTCTI